MPTVDRSGPSKYKSHLYSTSSSIPAMTSTASLARSAAFNATPYMSCTVHRACKAEFSSPAAFFCLQCNALQCERCERQIHQDAEQMDHKRLNLNDMDDECCSIDKNHRPALYCPACAQVFCRQCFKEQHQSGEKRAHNPQAYREDPIFSTPKDR